MALKKKNKLQQIAAAVKRDLARAKLRRNKPEPKGNRTVARAATTTGAIPKTSLKQRALNVKGKAKSYVRKAKAVVAKVDTKAERSAIAKGIKGKVTKAVKNAKTKAKDIYRKVDTKSERKALLGKAKKAVSKKAKSAAQNLKKQANFRLNKLGLGGTKSRAKFKKDVKFAAKALPGKLRVARSNTAAKLRGVGVKAQLKGQKIKSAAKDLRGKARLARSNTAAKLRGVKVKLQLKKGELSNAAKNWSQKKKAAMKKLWEGNKK
jgi:hypothetical protein